MRLSRDDDGLRESSCPKLRIIRQSLRRKDRREGDAPQRCTFHRLADVSVGQPEVERGEDFFRMLLSVIDRLPPRIEEPPRDLTLRGNPLR